MKQCRFGAAAINAVRFCPRPGAPPVTGTALPGPPWSVGKGPRATARHSWEGSGGVPAFLARLTEEAAAVLRGAAATPHGRGPALHRPGHTPGGPPPLPPRLGLAHDSKCFGRASRSLQGLPFRDTVLVPPGAVQPPTRSSPGCLTRTVPRPGL